MFSEVSLRQKAQADEEEAIQQKKADRDLWLKDLYQLWENLQPLQDRHLNCHFNEEFMRGLGIVVIDLETDDDESDAARFPRFFIPRPPSFIENHPVDLNDRTTGLGSSWWKTLETILQVGVIHSTPPVPWPRR